MAPKKEKGKKSDDAEKSTTTTKPQQGTASPSLVVAITKSPKGSLKASMPERKENSAELVGMVSREHVEVYDVQQDKYSPLANDTNDKNNPTGTEKESKKRKRGNGGDINIKSNSPTTNEKKQKVDKENGETSPVNNEKRDAAQNTLNSETLMETEMASSPGESSKSDTTDDSSTTATRTSTSVSETGSDSESSEDLDDTVVANCANCKTHKSRITDLEELLSNTEKEASKSQKTMQTIENQKTDLKNKVSRLENKLEKSKARVHELEEEATTEKEHYDQLNNLYHEEQQKKDELDQRCRNLESQLKNERKSLKKEINDQMTNAETAIKSRDKYKKEAEEANDKYKEKKRALKELKEEIKDIKNKADTSETIKDLKDKIAELTSEKEQLQEKLSGKKDKPINVRCETPKKVTILGDSNSHKYLPNLLKGDDPSVVYDFQKIYTADEMLNKVNGIIDNHEDGQHYTLAYGTNDIRNGVNSDEIYEDIKKVTIKIRTGTGAMVQIIEIPPQADIELENAINHVNKRLKGFAHQDAGIIFTEMEDMKDLPKRKTLEKDGYHLTRQGAEYLAGAISRSEMITQHLAEIRIPPWLAKHIVGEKGRNINTLKNKSNCEIQIIGNYKVTIRGMRWNTEDVQNEIEKLRARHAEREEREVRDRSRSRGRNANEAGSPRYSREYDRNDRRGDQPSRSRSQGRHARRAGSPRYTREYDRRNDQRSRSKSRGRYVSRDRSPREYNRRSGPDMYNRKGRNHDGRDRYY